MGEAFLSKKKDKFQHQRDKAFEAELAVADLFSKKPETTTTLYRCMLIDSIPHFQVGDRVLIVDLGETELSVLFKNDTIGHVQHADGEKLKALFSDGPLKMLVGVVRSLPKIGRVFTISLEI